jgi:hypothetical protein
MIEQQGFFVKIQSDYLGPFADLKSARDEARINGPDLLIFHGVLKRAPEGVIDDSLLFLVPKLKKNE